MKYLKALSIVPVSIIVLGALFLVGLRSEERTSRDLESTYGMAVFNVDATVVDGIYIGDANSVVIQDSSVSAKLSEVEGKTLRELEEMVKNLGAKLKLAQETHDQELRRIGAAKFPSQFGTAGKLDTLKDFSEIRWSPRTPSCQSRWFQGAWYSDNGILGVPNSTTTLELNPDLTLLDGAVYIH